MRLLRVDLKRGFVDVLPEDREDLWLLSILLRPGDVVEGTVSRRIKREGERGSGRVFTFRVKVLAESVEFSGSSLRIRGKIVEGPEDLVGKGKYQSLEVREGTQFRVYRQGLGKGFIEELRRAEEESYHPDVLVVSVDDEEASFGRYSRRLTFLKTVRRGGGEETLRPFLGQVIREIEEAPEEIVVVGGPKVIIDELRKALEEKGTHKDVRFVVSPLSGEKGLRDIVFKRAHDVIASGRRARVMRELDRFLTHLAKGDGLASLNPLEDAEMGNVDVLLVHEDWVRENRELAHDLMEKVREQGGEVLIVTRDVDNEQVVKRLGGAIGIRRFKL